MPIDERKAFLPVQIAVMTISDTRTATDDLSGDKLAELARAAGHHVATRALVRDSVDLIVPVLREWVANPVIDVIISTGGTGITGRDVTPEAFAQVIQKVIPGFGELFRMLSYASIGTSAIQSRAIAGAADGTYLFALPGSPGAVSDAWHGILQYQLDSRNTPCNLVELMPRLCES